MSRFCATSSPARKGFIFKDNAQFRSSFISPILNSSKDNHERLLLEISDIKKTSQKLFDGLEDKHNNFKKAVESNIKELDERQQEGILKEKLIEKSLSEIIEQITEKGKIRDFNFTEGMIKLKTMPKQSKKATQSSESLHPD